MAFAKTISFLSLTMFLVFVTTMTSPKATNAQVVTLNTTAINIIGTALCTPTVFGPCAALPLPVLCSPLPNVTVQIQLNGVTTIATGVTAANGSLSITLNAANTNIASINVSNLTALVGILSPNNNICPILNSIGMILQGNLVPVGRIVNGVLTLQITNLVPFV